MKHSSVKAQQESGVSAPALEQVRKGEAPGLSGRARLQLEPSLRANVRGVMLMAVKDDISRTGTGPSRWHLTE